MLTTTLWAAQAVLALFFLFAALPKIAGRGIDRWAGFDDLPRSIVQTRQGNPAWAGQERDGQNPIRSDDMFFGGSSTDWVNLNKVSIPQADEQQRLLATAPREVTADDAAEILRASLSLW